MGSLTTSTVQARFNAGSYTGKKKDKAVGAKVAREAGVEEQVGNYWKNALKCKELDDIKSRANLARADYYRFSTEWLEGVRVMPVAAYHEYAPMFREHKSEWQESVDTFVSRYPMLIQEASDRLKDLYNPNDYPFPDEIASKFYMDFRIFPFPDVDTDFRVQLIQEEMEEVKANMRKDFADAQASAVRDMYNRIEERVAAMHEALAAQDRKLYDSMFEHAKTLCDDIKVLNFMGDTTIESLRIEMLNKLASLNPDVMRAESGIPGGQRATAADNAKSILARVQQLRGSI